VTSERVGAVDAAAAANAAQPACQVSWVASQASARFFPSARERKFELAF